MRHTLSGRVRLRSTAIAAQIGSRELCPVDAP